MLYPESGFRCASGSVVVSKLGKAVISAVKKGLLDGPENTNGDSSDMLAEFEFISGNLLDR